MESQIREWLVEARMKKKMSHQQVADIVGVSRSIYTRYELGTRTPKPEIASKISHLLGVRKEKFFWP